MTENLGKVYTLHLEADVRLIVTKFGSIYFITSDVTRECDSPVT
jgi:hypothetical protein